MCLLSHRCSHLTPCTTGTLELNEDGFETCNEFYESFSWPCDECIVDEEGWYGGAVEVARGSEMWSEGGTREEMVEEVDEGRGG